ERLDAVGELVDPGDVDPRVVSVQGLEGQDEFLEARVAGAFPEAIHTGVGHRDAGLDRRQAVRHREPEVVVAVEREFGRLQAALRSEERRVGKGGRARWAWDAE